MAPEHARDICGGPAWCAACNARMIEFEGRALRLAVQDELQRERRAMSGDPDAIVIARVERYWRDSKRYRDKYREWVRDVTTMQMA